METEGFADYVVEKSEIFQVMILQCFIAQYSFLFFVEFFTSVKMGVGWGLHMYSGFAPRWRMVQADVAMEVCCPAINNAIII